MDKRPVLIVTRKVPDAVGARAQRDYQATLNPTDRPYTTDDLVRAADAAAADALLIGHANRLDEASFARLPKTVRAIATFSVGHEHIDLDAARRHGVMVANTPDVLTDATADIVMLLILGAARRAGEAEALMRRRAWRGWGLTEFLGTDVSGKVLGIVGMGRIGQAVAQRARGFNMKIHYHNRRRLDPAQELGATFHEQLEDMLPLVDFLSLNCPATPDTTGLLNAARIALLPPRAIVVNAARGAVIDDEALIAALRSGRLRAAGLDVYTNEPDVHPGYADLPNTFLLPHLGSATVETRDAMGFRALDNLDAFFAGREPPDRLA